MNETTKPSSLFKTLPQPSLTEQANKMDTVADELRRRARGDRMRLNHEYQRRRAETLMTFELDSNDAINRLEDVRDRTLKDLSNEFEGKLQELDALLTRLGG